MKKKNAAVPIISAGPFGQSYGYTGNVANENMKLKELETNASRSKQALIPHRPIDKSPIEPLKSNSI